MAPAEPKKFFTPLLWKRLAIWGAFLLVLRLTRDFFFVGFATFLFSYIALSLIDWIMHRVSPKHDRPVVRRLLTIGLFLIAPLGLLILGSIFGPRLLAEAQHLAAWVGQLSPAAESARILESWIGPFEFHAAYAGPNDPKYIKDLETFRGHGVRHVQAYQTFPALEKWVEGAFRKQFADAKVDSIRDRLYAEGPSSQEFTDWFVNVKFPKLRAAAAQIKPGEHHDDPLVLAATKDSAEEFLKFARHDATALACLQADWVQDTIDKELAQAKRSPEYQQELRKVYDQLRLKKPDAMPFDFDQYLQLQRVRPEGPTAFGRMLGQMRPTAEPSIADAIRSDFEAAKKHELFQVWWTTNSFAKFLRTQAESRLSGGVGEWLQRILAALIDVPLDTGTALLLSFFICIDFPGLRTSFRRLRETWVRDVYDEIVPSLAKLGQLIGKALLAQGLIAACNAALVFVSMWFLGVDHELLLSAITFVLCLVPTLGSCLAIVVISGFALVQYDGGVVLALKAGAAVVGILILESFVLSPRILGKMMEVHPVLIIALLPIAQYSFGIWGLILATPVAVYVINEIIFAEEKPGEPATC